MVILFPNDSERGYAIITPSGDMPPEAVALKDVPEGLPFLLIDGDIPDAVSFGAPDGRGLGHEKWAALVQQEIDRLQSEDGATE